MRWERRFDLNENREVLELVLNEDEADLLPGRLPPKPVPRPPFASISGKWPGSETDEEIQEALDALS